MENESKRLKNAKYTYGVKNQEGEVVIRPLNEEEVEFLKKFNNEYYSGNLTHTEEDLHHNLIKSTEDEVLSLKEELSAINLIVNGRRSEFPQFTSEDFKVMNQRKFDINERLMDIDYKSEIYKDGHGRRLDVSNYKRVQHIEDMYNSATCGNSDCDRTEASMLDYIIYQDGQLDLEILSNETDYTT